MPGPLPHHGEGDAEELLRRALLDEGEAAAVALNVDGLPLSEAVTVIFHGRRDLGTIQTYVAPGGHRAGEQVAASDLLRVPCDLDLAGAEDRDEAELLYAEQARAMRDAVISAEAVLDIWREPLGEIAGPSVMVNRSVELDVELPAHRLLPVALVAPERRIVIAPVCGARTLAHGRPPIGIACAQQEVTRVYPLRDDPERCLADFLELATDHAHRLADQIEHQEASIERFLEISGEDFGDTG